MPRKADLARHVGALVVAGLGTLGVFGLSLGMNAQVEAKAPEVATVIEAMAVAAPPKAPTASQKRRSSPVKKARKAAPSPAPLLAANLGGLDFGLGDPSDAALADASDALVGGMGSVALDEDDVQEPPVATTRTPPSYPARARAKGRTGWVTLSFVVDLDGTVQDVHVFQADPPGVFDDAAIEAVSAWRFEPGRHEGTPVAVRVRQTLRFELE